MASTRTIWRSRRPDRWDRGRDAIMDGSAPPLGQDDRNGLDDGPVFPAARSLRCLACRSVQWIALPSGALWSGPLQNRLEAISPKGPRADRQIARARIAPGFAQTADCRRVWLADVPEPAGQVSCLRTPLFLCA